MNFFLGFILRVFFAFLDLGPDPRTEMHSNSTSIRKSNKAGIAARHKEKQYTVWYNFYMKRFQIQDFSYYFCMMIEGSADPDPEPEPDPDPYL
jgi:hypothetical protein